MLDDKHIFFLFEIAQFIEARQLSNLFAVWFITWFIEARQLSNLFTVWFISWFNGFSLWLEFMSEKNDYFVWVLGSLKLDNWVN